ncbi:MAG: glycoside hydrolase family 10 protein [Nannocystaceae bacterium]|nr:family 10 glycosylhydrolase [bacterium]
MDGHRIVALLGAALGLGACAQDAGPQAWDGETDVSAGTGGSEGEQSTSDSPQTTGSAGGTTEAPDASSGEADTSTGALPEQPTAAVSHAREFRAAWIATVSNINYPSSQSLSVEASQAELRALLDVAAAHRLNAIIFQVRPESDALYDSPLEPWSRFLTGAQGEDPGFDPLAYLIEQAHPMGIEVHAWVNPYRAKSSLSSALAPGHIALEQAGYAYEYGNLLWMDPGAEPVQERTIDVVLDIIDRYDVDGIHFDDYFYPYPNGSPFPDGSTYGDYQDGGGDLSLDDWRRDNVNQLVEVLYESIVGTRDHIRFGISPFGIYRPGMPEGIVGLDQYAEIFADPLLWMDEGWVDYLAPQLYWPTTQTQQAYEPLLEWWSSMTSEGRYIFTGNYLSQVGSSSAWDVDELLDQVEISRVYRDLGSMGNIYFHIEPLESDTLGVGTALVETFYDQPVLTPPLAARIGDEVPAPYAEVEGETVTLTPRDDTPLRAWAVYRDEGDGFALERLVPATQTAITLGAGSWAVSAAARSGVESDGVLVEL